MALTILVVVLGRQFNFGSLALQESVTYMHAMIFMLCLGFALKEQEHVRVDIVYRRLNRRQKAWVDAVGSIVFLLPFAIFLMVISVQFALESWRIHEGSSNPGGIHAVYLLKTLIPVGGFLLALQGIAQLIQNTLHLLNPKISDGAK